jgi:hypothetical protein
MLEIEKGEGKKLKALEGGGKKFIFLISSEAEK